MRNSHQRPCYYLGECARQPSTPLPLEYADTIASQLIATLHQAQAAATRVSAPVKLERFDNLSTWDIFQVPRLVEAVGSDHVAQMNVVLPVTCVGPLDTIVILVNISPNPDWPSKARKIRVSKIQVYSAEKRDLNIEVSVEEVLSLRPPPGHEIITKKKRILRTDLDCSGVKLDVPEFNITLDLWLITVVDEWHCPRDSYSASLQGYTRLQGWDCKFCFVRLSIGHGIYHELNTLFHRISVNNTCGPFWSQRFGINATNPCLLVGFGSLLTDHDRYRKSQPISEKKRIISATFFGTEQGRETHFG